MTAEVFDFPSGKPRKNRRDRAKSLRNAAFENCICLAAEAAGAGNSLEARAWFARASRIFEDADDETTG